MNTPKKKKAWRDRTTSARRTRKSKPYDGARNLRSSRIIGEGIGPQHEARMLSHGELKEFITGTLAGQLQFMPTRDQRGQDLAAHGPEDRSKFSRIEWRKMMAPWRRSEVN